MSAYFTGPLWTYFATLGAGIIIGLWFWDWLERIGRLWDDFQDFVESKRKGQASCSD